MNIYRCSYPGAGRVYVIVAAVHILFDRYHFNMLKNPVQLTDIIERQGPLATVLGDVMLETHVLPKLIGKAHKIIAECIGITWVIFAQMIIIR